MIEEQLDRRDYRSLIDAANRGLYSGVEKPETATDGCDTYEPMLLNEEDAVDDADQSQDPNTPPLHISYTPPTTGRYKPRDTDPDYGSDIDRDPIIDRILDHDLRETFEEAFYDFGRLYDMVDNGSSMPSPDDFAASGYDFAELVRQYQEGDVIVIANQAMDLDKLYKLYEKLCIGLRMDEEAASSWQSLALDSLPKTVKTASNSWTIRIIPGEDPLPWKNGAYDKYQNHPTVIEYLLLQAHKKQKGQPCVDRHILEPDPNNTYYTWLQGNDRTRLGGAPHGTCHGFFSGSEETICIGWKSETWDGRSWFGIRPAKS
ncbi:hypothetical protein FWG95_02035 [Candidatus Saccharibacteria bacterium]|nr:hypothetical protein [Candidatus Saccharibacteria bacterium]